RRECRTAAEPLAPAPEPYVDLAEQVLHAVRREQCRRVSDFLLRRTLLGFARDQGVQIAPEVASLMGRELRWSPDTVQQELQTYFQWVESTQEFRRPVAPVKDRS
ncbi:MAG: hypothetical protein M1436_01085, partial [Acidobacteria bacterium]|nr:hypothetical protein [Acidobacteriota bacterium]